jgi:hypothetical protein
MPRWRLAWTGDDAEDAASARVVNSRKWKAPPYGHSLTRFINAIRSSLIRTWRYASAS